MQRENGDMVEVAYVQARRAYGKVPREGPGGDRDAIKEGMREEGSGGRALCEPLLYGRTAAYG